MVELDAAVLDAGERVFGLSLRRCDASWAALSPGKRRELAGRGADSGLPVVHSDAEEYVRLLPAGTLDCILLDAYDGRGKVPEHIRAAPFVRALGEALAPGAVVLANLWHGTAEARAEADRFACLLARSVSGLRVFSLRVAGQAKHRILLAVKADAAAAAGGGSEAALGAALKQRLQRGAEALAPAVREESALAATMRSNLATFQAWRAE